MFLLSSCPYMSRVRNHQRDGFMCVNGNSGANPTYEPNNKGFANRPERSASEKPIFSPIFFSGEQGRYASAGDPKSDYVQPGLLYRLMTPDQKNRLIGNLVDHMKNATRQTQLRAVEQFMRIDKEYGQRILDGLKSTWPTGGASKL